jgi:alpha-glucosidase
MARLASSWATALLSAFLTIAPIQAQSSASTSATPTVATYVGVTTTITYKPEFTIPSAADNGQTLLPNIQDPQAVDAQTVCPGYKASDWNSTSLGFTATLSLAGKACNVYGNDVDTLSLTVEYQSADRLSVYITPANLVGCSLLLYPLQPAQVSLMEGFSVPTGSQRLDGIQAR